MKHSCATFQFGAKERQHLPNSIIDIDIPKFQARFLRKSSQALDYIGSASAVACEAGDRVARFCEIGRITVEPAQASVGIPYYGRQRLIDLVNDRPGELTHCPQP